MTFGLWACGTVGRAHGLKGEFYLDLLPNGISYLTGGERFFLDRQGADDPQPIVLERAGGTDTRPLLRLAGVDSREAVIALQGSVVLASGSTSTRAPTTIRSQSCSACARCRAASSSASSQRCS